MQEKDPLFWQILLQIFLILLNAVFSCAEIAIISINDNKLEKLSSDGNKNAKKLLSLTNQPAKFLATIQVGITLAGFLGSAFAADSFSNRLVGFMGGQNLPISDATLKAISVIIITLILSYFTLIFGELVPKRIGMSNAEKIGLSMAGFIYLVSKIFAPLVWLLTSSTNLVLRVLGFDPNATNDEVTEEEIRMMVDAGSEKGTIDVEEKEFINNVFELDNKYVDELMTHRMDVTLLWLSDSDETWEQTIEQSRFSMYPICADTPDDVRAVLNAKEYLRLKDRTRKNVMLNAVKPAWFVPEVLRADVLFSQMKKNRNHFAIVVDEYGGLSGIVSMSDVIEQLLGDIEDNVEVGNIPMIKKIDDNTWLIQGSAKIEDVCKNLNINLPVEDYNTFSGLLLESLGYVPLDGSKLELEAYNLKIKINNVKKHTVETATVIKMPQEETLQDAN